MHHAQESANEDSRRSYERLSIPAASLGTRPLRVDGRYDLREVLGTGGMGIVYLARRVEDGVTVAIKVLRPEYAADARITERLHREAEALRRVRHPNVVQLLDAGDAPGIGPYLVFEHLEGDCLTDRMAAAGRLDVDEALDIADQLLGALEAAHAVGVIHRDLKPENAFLVPEEGGEAPTVLKVLDFGISRILEDGEAYATRKLTRTGTIVGTPIYMSPEQAMGESTQDERVDVYAVGVLLYEMLSGAVPHDGENYGQILAHVLSGTPIPLELHVPGIDPDLAAIVHRAFARDLGERFESASALRNALTAWRRGESYVRSHETQTALAAPETDVSRARNAGERPVPTRMQWLLAAALACVVVVAASFTQTRGEERTTARVWPLAHHLASAIAQHTHPAQFASRPAAARNAERVVTNNSPAPRARTTTAASRVASIPTPSALRPIRLVTANPYRHP
jgi:serine/threonine protein kinase